jgi:peptide/nickel transport system ATP-binding protein
MVARALLIRPRLIVADEPVSMVDASLRATILDSLRQLNQQFGISLVYITHDLTTAYQISEHIIVLYRGSVAEAGDVELVVKQPRHPYTQLLIGSIPLPDPDRPWQHDGSPPADAVEQIDAGGGAATVSRRRTDTRTGCKFAARCPHTMAMCLEARPPLFRTDGTAM